MKKIILLAMCLGITSSLVGCSFGNQKVVETSIVYVTVDPSDAETATKATSVLDRDDEYPTRLELTIDNAYSTTGSVSISQLDSFAKDGFGHAYNRLYVFSDQGGSDDTPESATFYVAERYKELSATIYVPYCSINTKEPTYPPYVRIYGDDDAILYEIKDFKGTMDPVDLKIDITDQKFIKIEVGGGWYVGDGTGRMPCFCVTNVVVTK